MRPQRQPALESDQQMLAARLDRLDAPSLDAAQVRNAPQPGSRVGARVRDGPPGKRLAQDGGSSEDRVAFGHAPMLTAR